MKTSALSLALFIWVVSAVAGSAFAGAKPPREKTTYLAKQDDIRQSLTVSWVSEKLVKFEYSVTNARSSEKVTISGSAKARSGDAEIDEDDGEAYPCLEYWYQSGSCRLSFRIDLENWNRAIVRDGGCTSGFSQTCPAESVAILRTSSQ